MSNHPIEHTHFCESDRQDFHNDRNLFSSEIVTPHYQGPRAKAFSTMMTSCTFWLYDHPDILAIYPYGFYSDNSAFIPVTMYDRMRECEPLAVMTPELKSYWNLCGLVFIPFLTKMVERKYAINFSTQEKETILFSALEYSFIPFPYLIGTHQVELEWSEEYIRDQLPKNLDDKLYQKYLCLVDNHYLKSSLEEIFQGNSPVYLSNQQIAQLGTSVGVSNGATELISGFTDSSAFIDYALLKNSEISQIDHPFSKLAGKTKFPDTTLDIVNMEQEHYRNLVDNLPLTQAYKIYAAFEVLAYQMVQESNNEGDLLRKIKGLWTNLAVETHDFHFEVILNSLYKSCLLKFSLTQTKLYVNFDLSEKIAYIINENERCYGSRRSTIIDCMTKHNGLCANVRTLLEQKYKRTFPTAAN